MGENNGNHLISACSLLTNGLCSSSNDPTTLSPTFVVQNSSSSATGTSSSQTTQQFSADYLSQLLKDKKQLAAFPNMFLHLERLVDEGKY